MKLEKINENKIQILITINDLIEKNIDLHSFMSNSIETQELFFDVLNEAEKQFGFSTKNSQIKFEVIAINKNNFILTLTKINTDTNLPSLNKKQLYYKRKKVDFKKNESLYKFNCFEDFCYFYNLIKNLLNISFNDIAKEILLYSYKNKYFLILKNINFDYKYTKLFLTTLCEFSIFIDNSELFIHKLYEIGDKILNNYNLNTFSNCFVNKKN